MLCKKALNSTAMSAAVVASQIWLSLKSDNGCPSTDNTAMDRNTSNPLEQPTPKASTYLIPAFEF
jgi:hypothetical protein